MMTHDIVFLDFETTSKYSGTCQPVQLAAVVIDGRKLEVIEDSEFCSLIMPEFDEVTCKAKRLDPLTQESISIHRKTEEMLRSAPTLKIVWSNFNQYVKRWNPKGTKWTAPIMAGYNVFNYDSKIIDRIAGKDPYKLGPFDEENGECTLFNPRMKYDLIHDVQRWTHFNPEITSVSFDNIRKYTGMNTEGAHDALCDVKQGAYLLCRFLNMYKSMTPKLKFKDSCKGIV